MSLGESARSNSATTPAAAKAAAGADPAKLGMGLGVFTPSILTILGVILFLRLGWVVGNLGLVGALGVVALAHAITIATALSVSAVTTNMHVGAGGAYYIISRSLGLEIGGAIGIPLFLAQTFSVTLYAFGLAESLKLIWPNVPEQPVAVLTILGVSLLAGRGAKLALQLQIPIMVGIVLALASLAVGVLKSGLGGGEAESVVVGASSSLALWQGIDDGESFWRVFAVFFPAVTGIMAGISLSGDLRDPNRSIPKGTMLAVLVGFGVYMIVPVLLALSASPETLVADNLIWFKIAAFPLLIFPGLWGAIFSSAVGSILGAPRTLEALAADRVLPSRRRRRRRPKSQAGMAHLLSTLVALSAVALGDLNAVAPVLTMFFLTTYSVVNLVAGLERLSGSPSYRPTIQVPWWVSLAGALGCFGVMVLINHLAALVALVVEVLIYVYLRRRSLEAAWGDLRYGALMSLARSTMLKLRDLPPDPRNWRPMIMLFAGDVERRAALVRFGSWLNQDRGILTVCELMEGTVSERGGEIDGRQEFLDRQLRELGIVAFPEVNIVRHFEDGALNVAQANGIAGISSNTIMFGWSTKLHRAAIQLRVMNRAARLGKSTVIGHIVPQQSRRGRRRIDVWWGGLEANGDLLLLFAHLLSLNEGWKGAEISVKSIALRREDVDSSRENLETLLGRSRIEAHPDVILKPPGLRIQQIIQDVSRDADLVFLGLQDPPGGEEEAYAKRLATLIDGLPSVMLVRAAGAFAGRLLEPGQEPVESPQDEEELETDELDSQTLQAARETPVAPRLASDPKVLFNEEDLESGASDSASPLDAEGRSPREEDE
ncbi:MAG: Na-K-Cl cotransporter [Acidobacteriota bacterium]